MEPTLFSGKKKKINYLEEGVLTQRPRFFEPMEDFGYSYFIALKHTSGAFIHKVQLPDNEHISSYSAEYGNSTCHWAPKCTCFSGICFHFQPMKKLEHTTDSSLMPHFSI